MKRRALFFCPLIAATALGAPAQTLTTVGAFQTYTEHAVSSTTRTIPTLPCSTLSAPRIFNEVDDRALTTLHGNVHPLAQQQYDRGRVSDSLAMEHMILMLRRSPERETALATRIQQMHDPHSPEFHQWLTAEQIGQCYGVAQADVDKVTAWLQGHGLRVEQTPAGQTAIIFSGMAGQVRAAFRTEIHNLELRGEQHIANMTEPQVPAALAPVIAGFRSLNDFFPKPLLHMVGPIRRDSTNGKWHPVDGNGPKKNGPGPLINFGGDGVEFYAVGPQDFYTIYNENPLLTATVPINGAGETLAIVQDSDVNPQDVVWFRSQFGLPPYPQAPNHTQGGVNYIYGIPGYCSDPGITPYGETEADVDLEWIGVTAPAAIIDFVSCADTQTTFGGDLSALYIVNTLASSVSAFSVSFGECEAQLGSSNSFYNQLWQQAAAEGQTPVIASGDSADDVCDRGNMRGWNGQDVGATGLSVNGLASTPYNVAAGGTDFSDTDSYFGNGLWWTNGNGPYYESAYRYVPEVSWNDTCTSTLLLDFYSRVYGLNYSNGAEGLCNDTTNFQVPYPYTYLDGGSGGISAIYGLPSWQSVYGVGLSTNYTSTQFRNLPDVSLFAADGFWNHVLVFCESDLAFCDFSNNFDAFALSAGGTSFVAPQLAGIMGLVNQATGVRQGQANYTFYRLATLEYGSPSAPNTSTTVPSLYTCEGSNYNVILNSDIFLACVFHDINRTQQYGGTECRYGDDTGCLVANNDQPCITGTPNCYTNTPGDRYGLLSTSTSTFQGAFPQSFGYSAATGLGSINLTSLVNNWNTMQGDFILTTYNTSGGIINSNDGFINCGSLCTHAYPPGSVVTLSATPSPGAFFYGWANGGCSGTGYCNLTINSDISTEAIFNPISSGYYTLSVTVAENGTVTSADGMINCPGTCSAVYQQNSHVTLNTSSGAGSRFGGWIGPCSGTAPCNLTMTQNYSVTGEFTSPVQFVPVTPCRLADTRDNNEPIRGGTSRNFPLPQLGGCNIPNTATAYSLNVTAVPEGPLNYLTIWPVGVDQPLVSTLNSFDARTKANAAIVPAGFDGAVSVYVTNTTHLILDINGYFAPFAQGTLQFYPLTPCRVVDTRRTDFPQGLGAPSFGNRESRPLPVLANSPCLQGLPQQPLAYSFNVTVAPVHGQPLNYLTIWPSDQQQPYVSTLNNPTATAVANAAIVPAAANGDVSVFTSNSTDVIIDINGYFAAPGQGGYSFYPVAPCRVLDTRNNYGQPFQHELTVSVVGSPCAPPSSATAYVFNATVVPPGFLDYLTLWPDGLMQPLASTLNAYDGLVTSNMAIIPTTNGSIDAYASQLTHLILDISGYFAP